MSRSLVVDASVVLKWVVTDVLLAMDFDAVLVTADERLQTAATDEPIRLLGH